MRSPGSEVLQAGIRACGQSQEARRGEFPAHPKKQKDLREEKRNEQKRQKRFQRSGKRLVRGKARQKRQSQGEERSDQGFPGSALFRGDCAYARRNQAEQGSDKDRGGHHIQNRVDSRQGEDHKGDQRQIRRPERREDLSESQG